MTAKLKSSINLYRDEFKPVKEALTLTNLTWVSVILLTVMLAWGLSLSQQQRVAKDEAAQLRAQVNASNKRLDSLRQQANQQTRDPVLVRRVERAEKELKVKKQVLDKLINGDDLGDTQGFSPALQALSDHHDSRISLSQIQIHGRKVSLWGATAEGRAIPQWLAGMNASEYFTGQRFDMMTINRAEAGDLSFSVRTEQVVEEQAFTSAPGSTVAEGANE